MKESANGSQIHKPSQIPQKDCKKLWWEMDNEEELSRLLGKCGHFLYHRPERGRMQEKILKILSNQDYITQKELQDKFSIKPGSISEIISKLEDRRLLVRERDEKDRRRVMLKITEEGREDVAIFFNEEKGKNLYAALSEEEQEILKKLLKKLIESWYKH